MLWILVLVVLVAGSVALARRGLAEWWAEGRPAVSTGLVYAAAVVVGVQVTAAAIEVSLRSDVSGFNGDDLPMRDALQSALRALADIVWQAGLLLALAVLVARVSVRARPAT